MIHRIRRHLGWKLFLSYLAVILVGAVVVAAATELALPTAFDRHLAAMAQMMGGQTVMGADLSTSFRKAVTEALTLAILVAGAAALSLSLLISRRVVAPVQEMMSASRRIADGRHEERPAGEPLLRASVGNPCDASPLRTVLGVFVPLCPSVESAL